MLSGIFKYLEEKERAWRQFSDGDLNSAAGLRKMRRHFFWSDHAFLRVLWTNFYQIDDGVFRSNQPSPKRLVAYQQRGIRSVLNLRGASRFSPYLLEQKSCNELGLNLVSQHMGPVRLPDLAVILQLEQHFKTLEKPFVLHCKSGADRAGFVSALYLLMIKGTSIEQAQRQLGLRYLHIKSSKKGIFDYCLEKYRKTYEDSGIGFRDWVISDYDPEEIGAEFKAYRKGKNG